MQRVQGSSGWVSDIRLNTTDFEMQSTIQVSIKLILLVGILALLQQTTRAQAVRPPIPPPTISAEKSSPGAPADDQAPTALDYEMRAKRAIKYAEKEHEENLSRAKEISQLGNQLATSFKSKQALDSTDLKKLEKLEKLTRKIRSEVGASDDDEVVLEEKPHDLSGAVECVAKVSSSLSEKVVKTPRQVVSAAIIEESNVLLELVRIVRNLAH